jgi:multimeric flavodoxin WrbA
MDNRYIMVLHGSPRLNGNSAALAEQAASGARFAGADVETFFLHGMDIRPCDACDSCQGVSEGACMIDDDMQLLYPKLRQAAGILIASPVYWFTLSAQTKLCIDRWYALEGTQGSALAGKRFGLLLSYGDIDPFTSGAINALRTFQDMVGYLKGEVVGYVYGSASKAGEIRSQSDLMEKAYRLGQEIAEGKK